MNGNLLKRTDAPANEKGERFKRTGFGFNGKPAQAKRGFHVQRKTPLRQVSFPYSTGNPTPNRWFCAHRRFYSLLEIQPQVEAFGVLRKTQPPTGGSALSWKSNRESRPNGGRPLGQPKHQSKRGGSSTFNGKRSQANRTFHVQRKTGAN